MGSKSCVRNLKKIRKIKSTYKITFYTVLYVKYILHSLITAAN